MGENFPDLSNNTQEAQQTPSWQMCRQILKRHIITKMVTAKDRENI
jgi:hypothetical protein